MLSPTMFLYLISLQIVHLYDRVLRPQESGSMSTELAEPLSAPTHLPQELPPTEGGYGVVGPAGFPSIGVTLGYNNGLPGPF